MFAFVCIVATNDIKQAVHRRSSSPAELLNCGFQLYICIGPFLAFYKSGVQKSEISDRPIRSTAIATLSLAFRFYSVSLLRKASESVEWAGLHPAAICCSILFPLDSQALPCRPRTCSFPRQVRGHSDPWKQPHSPKPPHERPPTDRLFYYTEGLSAHSNS